MAIHGIEHSVPFGPDPLRSTPPGASEIARQDAHAGSVSRRASPATPDRVEISDAARTLSDRAVSSVALANEVPTHSAASEITPERVRLILQRITNEFYQTPDVLESTAYRVLPDVQSLPLD